MEIKEFDVVILNNGKSGIVALVVGNDYHVSINNGSDKEEIIIVKKEDIMMVV